MEHLSGQTKKGGQVFNMKLKKQSLCQRGALLLVFVTATSFLKLVQRYSELSLRQKRKDHFVYTACQQDKLLASWPAV